VQLFPLILICAGIFWLLRFSFMDRFEARFNSKRLAVKIAKASSVAALRTIRDLSFTAFVVYLAVWLFIVLSTLRGGVDPQTFGSAISWLQGLMTPLKAIAGFWAKTLFGLSLLGLAYLYYRRQRKTVTESLRASFEEAVRVASQKIRDEEERAQPLPPNLE
jgi:ABC-type multidrug transport system fused ATPase/permease subunit